MSNFDVQCIKLMLSETVMVAPMPVSGQVSPGGKSITLNMDIPEQKQWWQLEEVYTCCRS